MRKMNKFVALMLAFVILGCWGLSSAGADDLAGLSTRRRQSQRAFLWLVVWLLPHQRRE